MEQLLKTITAYSESPEFKKALDIPAEAPVTFVPLAQGEYHRNFVFAHPITEKKYVLRVNYGSQMHLDNQIGYEYKALDMLKFSGRTPVPVFVDNSGAVDGHGILVMAFIEGRPLDYERDLFRAAACLADVHSTPISSPESLIEIGNPIKGILEECEQMFAVYKQSAVADPRKVAMIEELMGLAYQKADEMKALDYQNVCINTELNNHNFLVNEKTGFVSLIDWEKPLWGDPAQDLGHMLAPTTSFWRTDIILKEETVEAFVRDYRSFVDDRIRLGNLEERVKVFLPVTCLRGITWCAMAYVEYMTPGRAIANPDTLAKLKAYQTESFLQDIKAYLLK
ncbi:MAG: aminoglycoside phosphotransferase family protein [Lachnospiraceae bacterium]|nr:aminoglycoside phosphotransferase family protein [Lachnospiraceae bacterium]